MTQTLNDVTGPIGADSQRMKEQRRSTLNNHDTYSSSIHPSQKAVPSSTNTKQQAKEHQLTAGTETPGRKIKDKTKDRPNKKQQ